MSQPFDNDFNNNQNSSASDIQNVNNPEAELQNPQFDCAVEPISASEKIFSETATDGYEPLLKGCEPLYSNANVDASEQNLTDTPSAGYTSEVANTETLNKNKQSDNELPIFQSDDNSASNNLSWEEINHKIKAVNDFAFCHIGNRKVPVYPYVVALTGHRDADINESVKLMAKNQLRSLAKAWDNACNVNKWQKVFANKNCNCKCKEKTCKKTQKTAPLIALVGLSDGAERLWAEIASELRDKEKFNIKIVAVASMPFRELRELALKNPDILSQSKNYSNIKEKIDYVIKNADGFIELPYEADVKEFLELYKELGKAFTGSAEHSKELAQILIGENKTIQDLQYKEYRKFMCVHSHTLIALTENAQAWKTANLSGADINKLDNLTSLQISRSSYKEKNEARNDLRNLIAKVKNSGYCLSENYDVLIEKVKIIAKNLFNRFGKSKEVGKSKEIPRTNAMIFYKLLGNVDAALVPSKHRIDGITFTSIGPVVCIHTKRSASTNNENGNSKNSRRIDVTVIVKDQPDDKDFGVTKSFSWNPCFLWFKQYKSIADFNQIESTITQLGDVNNQILENISQVSPYNKSSDFFKEEKKKFNPDDYSVPSCVTEAVNNDKGIDTLIRHFNYTDNLASYFHKKMNLWINIYWFIVFLMLILFNSAFVFDDYLTRELNVSFWGNNKSIPIYFIIWGLAAFIIRTACKTVTRKRYHKYYHFFRALAEGLRIQICWRLCDIDKDVPGQFDLHQIERISWLRAAFNGLGTTLPVITDKFTSDDKKLNEKFAVIKEIWIDSQLNFLTGKKHGERYNGEAIEQLEDNLLRRYSSANSAIAKFVYLLIPIFIPILSRFFSYLIYAFLFLSIIVTSWYIAKDEYYKISLRILDLKQKKQQLYPFRRAQLLLAIRLIMYKEYEADKERAIVSSLNNNENNNQSSEDTSNDLAIIQKDCSQILLDIGKLELAINADWLLGVYDRKFNWNQLKSMLDISKRFLENSKRL